MCEGYTDVIGFFQAGVPWAVATCGTALAEEHFTLLRNFAKRIVLAYDADAAGQSATSRVYEWERKHEVDVVVADLPRGERSGGPGPHRPRPRWPGPSRRPGRSSSSGWTACSSAGDLTTAEGRARAAEAALTAVAEHPDDLVRDQYVMQLADRCRLDTGQAPRAPRTPARPTRRPRRRRGARRGGHSDEPPPRDYPEDDGDFDEPGMGAAAPRLARGAHDLGPGSRRSSWPSIDPKK